jgi:hypothetical protein
MKTKYSLVIVALFVTLIALVFSQNASAMVSTNYLRTATPRLSAADQQVAAEISAFVAGQGRPQSDFQISENDSSENIFVRMDDDTRYTLVWIFALGLVGVLVRRGLLNLRRSSESSMLGIEEVPGPMGHAHG